MPLNGSLVNVDASHYSGGMFSSTVDPRTVNVNAMPEPLSNIQGAASYIPCQAGGRKINRRKINKISRKYKMKGSRKRISHKVRRIKSRVRSRYNSKSRRAGRSRSQRRGQKGGYAQYQNNMPVSSNFSTGGPLAPGLSALASPPPYQKIGCDPDNYNHFSNSGFPSKGWH
jgi:hypothetical protein